MKKYKRSANGFVSWPKWQLFGFESDPEGSFSIHLGKIDKPCELFVNYEPIKPEGQVTAELHVHPGTKVHTFEDSVPMTRGSTGEKATWKTGTVIPPSPSATVFLRLENARVYAYELRPV